jgi:hypothetical protein
VCRRNSSKRLRVEYAQSTRAQKWIEVKGRIFHNCERVTEGGPLSLSMRLCEKVRTALSAATPSRKPFRSSLTTRARRH